MLVPVLCRCFWLFIAIVYHIHTTQTHSSVSSSSSKFSLRRCSPLRSPNFKLPSSCHNHRVFLALDLATFLTRYNRAVSSTNSKIQLVFATRKNRRGRSCICRHGNPGSNRGMRMRNHKVSHATRARLLAASAFDNYSFRSPLDHYVTGCHPAVMQSRYIRDSRDNNNRA